MTEIDKRKKALTTSERQAQLVTGRAERDWGEDRDDHDGDAQPRRRELTTSERQAAYVLRANRYLQAVLDEAEDEDTRDERDERDEREAAWGDHLIERAELDGDGASRRQAARLSRGASRGGS